MSGIDSVLKALFGGSNSSQTSGPVDATPDWLKAFNNQLTGAFSQVFSGTGQASPYSGPQFEGVTAPEQGVLSDIQGGLGGTEQSRQKFLTDATSGQLLPGAPGGNPFLQNAIADSQRTTMNGLTDVLGKTLPGKFTAAGQFLNPGGGQPGGQQGGSSPFDQAAADATRGAADASASIATQALNNAWNAGTTQQTQASQISQGEITNATAKLTALGLPREIQGSNVNLGLQTWQTQLQGFLSALSAATGVGNNAKIATNSTGTSDSQNGIVPALLPKGLQGG